MSEPLTRARLQRLILEVRAALSTPIDFADLGRRGVLASARGGWWAVLKLKELPAHARFQVTSLRTSTRALPMVKFNERDDDQSA